MSKKLISFVLVGVFVLGLVSFVGVGTVNAQAAPSFPDGCGSALGYSSTTGTPCSGTSVAINKYIAGCSNSALGYSATTGLPCSGGSVAIQWLAGCTSTIGFSAESGEPCNGTNVATTVVIPPIVPGLPTTGAGGNAGVNVALMLASMLLAVTGFAYVANRSSHEQV